MPWDLTARLLSIPSTQAPTAVCLPECKVPLSALPNRFLFDRVHGKASLLSTAVEEDGDVQAERNRVESGKADFDVVQLQNLTKIYHLPHKRIVAVKNISLGIPAGEVNEGKRLRAPSALGREIGTDPQCHLFSQSLLLSHHNCGGLFCSDLFLPSFALFTDSWGYGSN